MSHARAELMGENHLPGYGSHLTMCLLPGAGGVMGLLSSTLPRDSDYLPVGWQPVFQRPCVFCVQPQ